MEIFKRRSAFGLIKNVVLGTDKRSAKIFGKEIRHKVFGNGQKSPGNFEKTQILQDLVSYRGYSVEIATDYRSSIDRVSVKYRSSIGRYVTDSRPLQPIDRGLVVTRSAYHRHITEASSTDHRQLVDVDRRSGRQLRLGHTGRDQQPTDRSID